MLDVVRDLRVGQFGCQIRAIERQVAFEEGAERLRYSIVPTVTPSALNSGVNCRLFLFVRSTSRGIIAPSEVSTKAGELQPVRQHRHTTAVIAPGATGFGWPRSLCLHALMRHHAQHGDKHRHEDRLALGSTNSDGPLRLMREYKCQVHSVSILSCA